MKIYNTLTRRVEEIVPLQAGKVKMYSCGPTVYRYIHIGNLRTFTMADWIRRTFEYRGFEVLHVKNITDVGHMRQEVVDRGEDKILAQARKEGLVGKTQDDLDKLFDEEHELGSLVMAVTSIQHSPRVRLVDTHGYQPRPDRGRAASLAARGSSPAVTLVHGLNCVSLGVVEPGRSAVPGAHAAA